jgi:hypothetical protein
MAFPIWNRTFSTQNGSRHGLIHKTTLIPSGGLALPMSAVYRAYDPPGPAGRWMVERLAMCLKQMDDEDVSA